MDLRKLHFTFAMFFATILGFSSISAAVNSCEGLFVRQIERQENFVRLDLYSPRLSIRMAGAEHVENILRVWSDPRVVASLSRQRYTLDVVKNKIRHSAKSLDGFKSVPVMELVIFSGEQFVGTMSVIKENWGALDGFTHPEYQIGYAIHPDFQNRGFATEAVQRTVRFLFEQGAAVKISAYIFETNENSAAVLRKSGFTELRSNGYDERGFILRRE